MRENANSLAWLRLIETGELSSYTGGLPRAFLAHALGHISPEYAAFPGPISVLSVFFVLLLTRCSRQEVFVNVVENCLQPRL